MAMWDRAAPWIAGAAVALLFVMAGVIIWQNYQQHAYVVLAHNNSAQQQADILRVLNEHTGTLGEVKDLRTELEKLVATEGPALTTGQEQLIARLDWIECSVSGTGGCGPKP